MTAAAYCWVCQQTRVAPEVCTQQCHTTNACHELADTFTREDHS